MRHFTTFMFSVALLMLTVVSMWTTYVSLKESILPTPVISVTPAPGMVWDVAVIALALSVGIGLMLLALKFAIINERRKLGIPGFVGLFVIAFISISFNIDVLYRVANQDFFIQYTDKQMRAVYEEYLAQAGTKLKAEETALLRDVARQEGELESEIRGLRQAPAGYGTRAKEEEYELMLLQKQADVDVTNIEDALASKALADDLLASTFPTSLPEIETLEKELRVYVKDVGAAAGMPLPAPVETKMPIFAVFENLFNPETVGFEEIFYLIIAVFLDLGDIVGFNLVARRAAAAGSPPKPTRNDRVPGSPVPAHLTNRRELPFDPVEERDDDRAAMPKVQLDGSTTAVLKPIRFGRRWHVRG